MASLEKFFRSKCPNCKKNGIELWKTGVRYNPKLTCKYCKKTYKVKWIVSFTATIVCSCGMGVILSLIRKYILEIPIWLCYIIILIPMLIFQYFAPLKEINKKSGKTGDGSPV